MAKRTKKDVEEEEAVTSQDDDDEEKVQEPPAKKQKLSQPSSSNNNKGPVQFREGAIVRVKIHNFMTYNDCEFWPGPGLNLVLGPNGTGKSSIVSAICVGLGGDPKILGRASRVKDYVKHNKKEGFIEIELFSKNKNVVISRILKQSETTKDVHTEWKVNGRPQKAEAVHALTKKFNIQLGNLTQFLPQDKVAEFSNMDSYKVLESTQEAVLSPEVIQYHGELAKKKKEFMSHDKDLDRKRKMLEDLKKKNEMLQKDVENYHKKRRHLDRIEKLRLKLEIAKFHVEQQNAKNLKIRKEAADKELAEAKEFLEPLRKKLLEIQDQSKQLIASHSTTSEKHKTLNAKVSNTVEKMSKIKTLVNEKELEKSSIRDRQQSREENIKKIKAEIVKIENEIANLASTYNESEVAEKLRHFAAESSSLAKQINELSSKRRDADREINMAKSHLSDVSSQIVELDNVKFQRLQKLKHDERTRPAYEAYNHAGSIKHKLKGEIYLVCLELKIENPDHANFIEMVVKNDFLTAIVVSNEPDRITLNEELIDKREFNVTIISGEDVNSKVFSAPEDIKTLQKYGFTGYLSDTFTCPDSVRRVLYNVAKLHQVPYGNSKQYMELLSSTNIHTCCTPESQFIGKRSKYGAKELSTRAIPMRKCKILATSNAAQRVELEKQEAHLKQQLSKLSGDRDAITAEESSKTTQRTRLDTEKKAVEEKKLQYSKLRAKLKSQQEKLDSYTTEEDVPAQIAVLNKAIIKANSDNVKLFVELKKHITDMVQLEQQDKLYPILRARLRLDEDIKNREINDQSTKFRDLDTQVKNLDVQFKEAKTNLQKSLEKVNKLKAEYKETHDMDEEELSAMLKQMKDNIDALLQDIDEETIAADSLHSDASAVDEYEKREKEITKITGELNNAATNQQNMLDEIKELETKWKVPLQNVVAQVNENFAEYCKSIGISGEVKLVENEDYSKYAIDILVKFRKNEQLTRLDSSRQSGGERSVTTILYLLALQNVNKSPFRVVDEINQGMDPQNERKVFNQMLKSSTGEDVPQSFLITPKLLPDLVPNNADAITVLFIYNGSCNIAQSDLLSNLAH